MKSRRRCRTDTRTRGNNVFYIAIPSIVRTGAARKPVFSRAKAVRHRFVYGTRHALTGKPRTAPIRSFRVRNGRPDRSSGVLYDVSSSETVRRTSIPVTVVSSPPVPNGFRNTTVTGSLRGFAACRRSRLSRTVWLRDKGIFFLFSIVRNHFFENVTFEKSDVRTCRE